MGLPQHVSLDGALSDDVELVRFDLAAEDDFPRQDRVLTVHATETGVAEGVIHWLRLEFPGTAPYDNRPPTEGSAWRPLLHVFPRPVAVEAGQPLDLQLRHDRMSVTIWPAHSATRRR